jgi:hypothetical protein
MAGANFRITIPEPLANAVSAESFRQGRTVSELITILLTETLPGFVARRLAQDLCDGHHMVDATSSEPRHDARRARAERSGQTLT